MHPDDLRTFYRCALPHYQPANAKFFVTWRLKNSLPTIKVTELKEAFELETKEIIRSSMSQVEEADRLATARKRHLVRYEELLHQIQTGPHYLRQRAVAQTVQEALHHLDGDLYTLLGYSIMSNHVHILIDTSIQTANMTDFTPAAWASLNVAPLEKIMMRIKGRSARYANLVLGRTGTPFWQPESYDYVVRNDRELLRILHYIAMNPVKAKLVSDWQDHAFTQVRGFEGFGYVA